MITEQDVAAARVRGAETILARYGLAKTANILSTLGSAASRALSSGAKAYQHGGGTMMQNVGKGLAAGAKGFQRAGGVPAAGKALGAATAAGVGMYGAGRAFGAGQNAAQKQAAFSDGDLAGVARTTALSALPGLTILQGMHRGQLHGANDALGGAARMLLGNTAGFGVGSMLGGLSGNPRAALLAGILGSGIGGHYATRKYLKPSTTPVAPSAEQA